MVIRRWARSLEETCSPPGTNVPAKLPGNWTQVYHIFTGHRRDISGVNAHIHVAILSSVVECQCTKLRWGMPIFADLCQKSVTIATSIERSQKEGRIDNAHPYKFHPENLLKVSPLHSGITDLQGDLI